MCYLLSPLCYLKSLWFQLNNSHVVLNYIWYFLWIIFIGPYRVKNSWYYQKSYINSVLIWRFYSIRIHLGMLSGPILALLFPVTSTLIFPFEVRLLYCKCRLNHVPLLRRRYFSTRISEVFLFCPSSVNASDHNSGL